MRPWIAAAALAAGLAAGYALGRAGSSEEDATVPRPEFERVERRLDEATARAEKAERALAAAPRDRTEGPGASSPPAADGSRPAARTETERVRRVEQLVGKIESRFAEPDGEGLLEILRGLSQEAPEGRAAAMALAVRIQEDLQGGRTLGLDDVAFATTLGDSQVRDLMVWALSNPSPPAFRVLTAWSLPWVLPREESIDQLTRALEAERDVGVQQSIVASLGKMRDSRVDAALAAIFRDPSRDASIRMRVAFALATSADEEIVGLLVAAAEKDPDERVRAAAKSALPLARPSADGYALTVVFPDGAGPAAGLRPGDIVVSYDGKPVRTTEDFLAAIEAASSPAPGAAETVAVTVVREGQETLLNAHRGRLGVQGRPVRKTP